MDPINTLKNKIVAVDSNRISTLAAIFFLIVSLYVAYTSYYDPVSGTANAFGSTGLISIPFMLGLGYFAYLYLASAFPSQTTTFIVLFSLFAAFIVGTYGYTMISTGGLSTLSYLLGIIMMLGLIVGLAIFFYFFSNYLKSTTGWGSVFVYFTFYLPCLLLDMMNYIVREFKITTRPVYILLVIELIVAALYIYLPKLFAAFLEDSSIWVLKESVFLDEPTVLPIKGDNLLKKQTLVLSDTQGPTIRHNYGVSMWVYMNNHSSNMIAYNKETNIFNYGEGKPKITFNNTDNDPNRSGERDTYRFYITNQMPDDGSDNYYDMKLASQKWNHIVFNYTPHYADLFINGRLERTFYFKNMAPPEFKSSDVVHIGATDGLSGAISNIRYYTKNVSKSMVSAEYNVLKKQSPPTI